MDSNTIIQVFETIIDDESVLDSIPVELVDEVYQFIGFYLLDRDLDIEELDFNE